MHACAAKVHAKVHACTNQLRDGVVPGAGLGKLFRMTEFTQASSTPGAWMESMARPRGRGDAFSRTFQTLAHLYVLSQTGNHGQQSGISISYSSMVFQCSPVSCVTLFCHTLHLFLYVFDFNNYIAWIKTSSIISCSYFILFLLELFISANIFFSPYGRNDLLGSVRSFRLHSLLAKWTK